MSNSKPWFATPRASQGRGRKCRRTRRQRGAHRAPFAAALLTCTLVFGLGKAFATETAPCPDHLVVIERSKNANVVAYDANRGPEGDLSASRPVVAYWLLNGEKDKRRELSAFEWQLAYGFDVMPGHSPGTFAMAFKADPKRRMTIRTLNGCPVLSGPIDGHDGILRRIFVQSTETFILPKVQYIELFGEDIATNMPLEEKSVPAN